MKVEAHEELTREEISGLELCAHAARHHVRPAILQGAGFLTSELEPSGVDLDQHGDVRSLCVEIVEGLDVDDFAELDAAKFDGRAGRQAADRLPEFDEEAIALPWRRLPGARRRSSKSG